MIHPGVIFVYLSERQLPYMDKDEHEKEKKLSSLITNL